MTYSRILSLTTAAAFTVAVVLPALTAERPAPEGGFVAHSTAEATAANANKPVNRPEWKAAYAHRFAGCTAQRTVRIAESVVAVTLDGTVEKVPTAQAWKQASRGDFWVVGFCSENES